MTICCPVCGVESTLVVGPTQAFCTNDDSCKALWFDPSLPDGGLSMAGVIDLCLPSYRGDEGRFFDRSGRSITFGEWELRFDQNRSGYSRIALTKVGEVTVSTVWLGMNHNFDFEGGPPLIFETMVFGGSLENQERYSTEEEAREGHAHWVAWVREKEGSDSSEVHGA